MNELPNPLTPPECDLTDFQYMELDVRRLRDSKFAATPNSDAFRAGVMLWCAAWHQVPAASLPDDDVELANLAGFGRMPVSVKEWKKVRAEALYGFVKCSDGRLYHAIIAEKALAAFGAKLKHAYDKFVDRLRKENSRRAKEQQQPLGIPTFEQWNSGEYLNGIPPESHKNPPERNDDSGGIPAENPLRGKREGKEQNGEGTEKNGEGDFLLKPSDPSGSVPADSPPKKTPKPKPETDTAPAWDAYTAAYRQRYGGVSPVRNATTNAQMANFVRRLGAEAPDVAEFYVAHNKAWYVQQSHGVGPMLSDAESLRTQWATGQRVTATKAQQADRTQTNGDVFSNLIAEAEAREAAHGN